MQQQVMNSTCRRVVVMHVMKGEVMSICVECLANVNTVNAKRPMLNANALCSGIVAVVPKTPRSKLAFYKRVDMGKRTNQIAMPTSRL
jgi:predicted dithiol-disulfide oxidoreductase (DUF899 family)